MNTFILEILPKMENGNQYVYVVRAQNGFPLAVCESLEGAKDVIQEHFDKARIVSLNELSKS